MDNYIERIAKLADQLNSTERQKRVNSLLVKYAKLEHVSQEERFKETCAKAEEFSNETVQKHLDNVCNSYAIIFGLAFLIAAELWVGIGFPQFSMYFIIGTALISTLILSVIIINYPKNSSMDDKVKEFNNSLTPQEWAYDIDSLREVKFIKKEISSILSEEMIEDM